MRASIGNISLSEEKPSLCNNELNCITGKSFKLRAEEFEMLSLSESDDMVLRSARDKRQKQEKELFFSPEVTPNVKDFILRDFSRKEGAYVWVRYFRS